MVDYDGQEESLLKITRAEEEEMDYYQEENLNGEEEEGSEPLSSEEEVGMFNEQVMSGMDQLIFGRREGETEREGGRDGNAIISSSFSGSPTSPRSSSTTATNFTGTHHRTTSSLTSLPTTRLSKSPPSGSPPPLPDIYLPSSDPYDHEQQRISFRIPLEILINISLFLPTSSRIKLSHVCRSYRHYLLHEPRLWKSIYLPLLLNDTNQDRFALTHRDKLQTFLQRARGGALDVTFEWNPVPRLWEKWEAWRKQGYPQHCETCFGTLLHDIFDAIRTSRDRTPASSEASPVLRGLTDADGDGGGDGGRERERSGSSASERRRYGPFRLRHLELKLHPPGNEISWSLLQRFIHAMIGSEEHVRTLVLSTGFEGFGLRQYALFFARNVEELVFSSEGILMDRSWYLERTIDWKTKKVLGTVKKNVKVTPNPNSQSAWYDRKSHTMTALEPEVGNGWIDYVTIVEERDEETGAVRPVKRALKRELVWDLSQITCFWRSESDMKSVRDYLTEPSSLRSLTLKNIKIGADFRLPPLPCLEILELEATQWVGRGWVPVLRNAQKSLRTFKAVDFVVDDVDKRRIGEADDFRNWVDNVYDIPYDVEEEEKIRIFREERKSFPFWNKNMVFTPKPLFMEKLETFICQGLSTPIWTSLHHWLDTDDDDEFDHDDDEEDDDVLLEDFGMDDASGTELEEGDPENILGEEVLDERDQEFLDLLESMGGSPKSKNRALVKRRERRLAKLIMMMRKKRLPTPELLMPRLKLLDLSTLDIFAGFGKWCGRGFVHFASGIGFAQWKSGVYDEKPDCAVYQAWLMEMLDRECEEGAQLARLASWSNGGVPVEEDDIQDPTSGVGYAIALGRNLSCNGMGVDHLLQALARDDEDLDEDRRWKRFRLNSSGLDDSALHSFLEAGMGLGMGLGCVGKSKSEGKDWKIALELSSTQATDRVIVCLPNICPSLRELDVRGADSVTCRGVARMVEKFRELSEGARRIERVFVNEPLKASFGAKIDWAVGGNWPKRLLKMTEPVDFSIPSAPGSGSSAPKLPKPTDVLPKDPEEAKLEEMRLGNGVHKSPWEYADSHQWEYRAYDWLHWVEVIPFSPKIDLRTFSDEERICMGLPPLETTKWAAATLLASLPTRRTSRAEELGKLPESHMTIGIRSQGGIGWGLGLGMNLRPMPWKW